MALSRGWKIGVIAIAVAGTLSTPAVWQLGNPDAGQLVGASIQGASGLAALVWAMLQPAPASAPAPVDTAIRTGKDAPRVNTRIVADQQAEVVKGDVTGVRGPVQGAQVYVRQRLGRVEGGGVVGVDGMRDH